MLNLSDAYAAWCLDGIVAHFGMSLEAALDEVESAAHKNPRSKPNPKAIERKKQRVLESWLGLPRKFREPTATAAMKE